MTQVTTLRAPVVYQDLQAELAMLRAENERLRAAQPKPKGITFKVSEKGAISAYGMGRFPVTLYAQQWIRLAQEADTLKAFIEDNRERLSWKE